MPLLMPLFIIAVCLWPLRQPVNKGCQVKCYGWLNKHLIINHVP
jgi:hypothetical protein